MKTTFASSAVLTMLAAGLAGPASGATEAWALYDAFSNGTIDRNLWSQGEQVRSTNGSGVTRLMARETGLSSSGGGSDSYSFSSSVANPSRVSQLSAAIKVTSVDAAGCAETATASVARARLIGAFFNTGNPRAGSFYGDVLAQIVLSRASNSTDAAGLVRVSGFVNLCTDVDCNNSVSLGSVDLGTAPMGQWLFTQIEHDRANKRFLFGRDSGATTMTVSYTVSDTAAPSRDFKQLSTRQTVARCASQTPVAAMDAQFTKVRVNKSAL